MEPQLLYLQKQLTENTDRFQRLFRAHSEEQLLKRPSSGGWCAAECLEHLVQSTTNYQDTFNAVLTNPPKGTGPYKMDFKGRLLNWVLAPPFWVKIKAPKMIEPHDITSAAKVLAEFEDSQKKLADYISKSDGLALEEIVFASPFDARIQYNLFSSFNILASHQRRHYIQAENAVK